MTGLRCTPGPWQVDEQRDYCPRVLACDPRATIVAEVSGSPSNPQAMADCHLIAAAPDLYAALEKIVNAASSQDHLRGTEAWAEMMDAALPTDDLRAVLARARGEE